MSAGIMENDSSFLGLLGTDINTKTCLPQDL